MHFSTLAVSIAAAIISYRTINLLVNYIAARKLQLPILITPLSWQEPWWLPLAPHFSFLQRLPFGLGAWVEYSKLGWVLKDRYRIHERLGLAFVIVSPATNEIFVADPAACEELLSKWRVWTKSAELYKIFDVFGKNVNTVNGEDWQRHRKIASYGFRESNNKLVWEESIRQAEGMTRAWLTKGKSSEQTMEDVFKDSGVIAMHVLAAAGFGKRYDFDSGLQEPDPGHKLSYGEATRIILHNLMFTILFDGIKAPAWLLPRTLKQIKTATKEFRQYLRERIQEEKSLLSQGKEGWENLSSILVSANEKEKAEEASDGKKKGVLTDDELYGNLFMFMVAGHETTANTFSYALPLLATHPEVQSWVIEEVDAVFEPNTPYQETFPKLVRCMAVMYETLRLWGPIQSLIKTSGTQSHSKPLTIGQHTYSIPPQTYLSVNFQALHTNPRFWGADSLEFRPERWITRDSGKETLSEVPENTIFVAWSHGPRVCPGKKFSQVEFVAVLAFLLKSCMVKPATRGRETEEQARKRLLEVVQDSEFFLAPKMQRVRDAGVVLEKRR